MNEFINFDEISRKTWQNLYNTSIAPLTHDELESIRSLNDEISLQDVEDVYLPLIHLLRLYKKNLEDMSYSKVLFLQKNCQNSPTHHWDFRLSRRWKINDCKTSPASPFTCLSKINR